MDEKQTEAKKACGYYTGEFVKYGMFEPSHNGLPKVAFAYVPLTANRRQEIVKEMDQAARFQQGKISVRLITQQLRKWDLQRPDGSMAECRDAGEIGSHVDAAIVEGIASLILDSVDVAEAETALANFPKP
jgi:hypothetical protein